MIAFKFLILCLLMSLSCFGWSQEVMQFSSKLNQIRYQSLVEELRCPKCQNQSLADSGSGIAVDLREQVHKMIEGGKSDQEIMDYMVARYGEFVLYRPPHSTATFLLWYGPFMLLGIGLIAFAGVILLNRKRRHGVNS